MRRKRPNITTESSNLTPYLSIIIPAYNEERRLPPTLHKLHEYLSQQPYSSEVIVVSNGSTDGTDHVARAAIETYPYLQLITTPERGKGLACRDGALRSAGQVIFLCDADLSMPVQEVARFLAAIERYDVVVGSREAPGAHRFHEPWHRHLMGRVFNRLVHLLAVSGIQDTQCGFKAFRRQAARDLFGQQTILGFGFDVEILFLARRRGYSIEELPIDWYFDSDTRVRPGMDSLRMVVEVLYMRIGDLLGHYGARDATPDTGRDDSAR